MRPRIRKIEWEPESRPTPSIPNQANPPTIKLLKQSNAAFLFVGSGLLGSFAWSRGWLVLHKNTYHYPVERDCGQFIEWVKLEQ